MFWDSLKPSRPAPRPTALDLSPSGELLITWDDGKTCRVPPLRLRSDCPCAACVDEWTGRRTLDPKSVPGDIRPLGLDPVGNYALRLRWSDGHDSGLYSWQTLRAYVDADGLR